MATQAHPPGGTSLLTIDIIWLVISRSIFHPFVAWLVPLCMRAAAFPAGHPHVTNAYIWAGIVSVGALLRLIDQSIADGQPRDIEWTEEVVVVTGGTNGLGKIIVEMLGMRGVSIAVLDVSTPTAQEISDSEALNRENIHWYQCDVSKLDEVERVRQTIEQDLGKVTILVNNAGIVHGLPLLSLTTDQITSTLNINLVAHFNTVRAFLPGMLAAKNGGTIVTVASVLGKLGAAQLTDYAASKAGLLALHESLTAELKTTYYKEGGANMRTVLVTPGQLATSLFHGMRTPSSFLGPVVEPVELAKEIVAAIDAGMNLEISLPLYAKQVAWMSILPPGVRLFVRWLSGVDYAMADMQKRRQDISRAKKRD